MDEPDQQAVARLQDDLRLGGSSDPLAHLGEAASIHILAVAGRGRLISDDHGARASARRARVDASSTVGVLRALMSRRVVTSTEVDDYLETLRQRRRMNVGLTAADVAAGRLASWA